MAGITIRVAPDGLKAKAAAIDRQISRIEKELKIIGDQIAASKNDWEGDSESRHQKKYKDLQDEMHRVISALKAHPQNLLVMAGLYSCTESGLQTAVSQLPDNVIS